MIPIRKDRENISLLGTAVQPTCTQEQYASKGLLISNFCGERGGGGKVLGGLFKSTFSS